MAGGASGYADEAEEGLITDINVTPLVDIVLVLLIVFMITMPTITGLRRPRSWLLRPPSRCFAFRSGSVWRVPRCFWPFCG